ncbi:hypothetical protein [Mediterraneibacter gnavus]|uniref:hypothetical protein n=1 Tax=Mediterraneibacter gnavus TaxID=33038 RepID=UPI003672B995
MKNFDWESFKEGKIVVHCKTKKEAEDFCLQMNEQGMAWSSGNSYLSYTHYGEYRDKTCYSGGGGYQSYDYFEKYKCNILEWSDYMQKEFTKADLKDGMVVEQRDGNRYLVLAGVAVRECGRNEISGYTNNLEWYGTYRGGDIVKVYRIIPESLGSIEEVFDKSNLELIWERKEPKKMTVEEMRKKLEELTGEQIEVTA